MVEVVRPMIMANAIHQDLQRTYFSIRFLLFQNPVTQMYALSYRYPLCATLLSRRRWIGNPINHSCTELLERACFQPHAIQRIQLAEVGWEPENKGFERKRGWVVCIKSCATFSVLF